MTFRVSHSGVGKLGGGRLRMLKGWRLIGRRLAYLKARRAALRRLSRGTSFGGGLCPRAMNFTTVPTFVDTGVLKLAYPTRNARSDSGHVSVR
jgi:hypothetical protein